MADSGWFLIFNIGWYQRFKSEINDIVVFIFIPFQSLSSSVMKTLTSLKSGEHQVKDVGRCRSLVVTAG